MTISVEITRGAAHFAYITGGRTEIRSFFFPEEHRDGAFFNAAADGRDGPAVAFLSESVDEVLGARYGRHKFVFLLPLGLTPEQRERFERLAAEAVKEKGEALFADKCEAAAEYLAESEGADLDETPAEHAVLFADTALTVCLFSLQKTQAGPEWRRKEEHSHPLADITEFLRTAASLAVAREFPDESFRESKLSLSGFARAMAEKRDSLGIADATGENVPLFSFPYGEKNCTLMSEDVFSAFSGFAQSVSGLGAIDLPARFCFCGTGFPEPIVGRAVSDALSASIDVPEKNPALLGALSIGEGSCVFRFRFGYDLGIKTFFFDKEGESVVVKCEYLTLVRKGESSADYVTEKRFDDYVFRVEDENENLVFFFRDDKGRIREMPFALASTVAKKGSELSLAFCAEGREQFFSIYEKEKRLLRISVPSLMATSGPALIIKTKE